MLRTRRPCPTARLYRLPPSAAHTFLSAFAPAALPAQSRAWASRCLVACSGQLPAGRRPLELSSSQRSQLKSSSQTVGREQHAENFFFSTPRGAGESQAAGFAAARVGRAGAAQMGTWPAANGRGPAARCEGNLQRAVVAKHRPRGADLRHNGAHGGTRRQTWLATGIAAGLRFCHVREGLPLEPCAGNAPDGATNSKRERKSPRHQHQGTVRPGGLLTRQAPSGVRIDAAASSGVLWRNASHDFDNVHV